MFINLTMPRARFVDKRLHGVKIVVNTNAIETFRRSTRDPDTTIIGLTNGSTLYVAESVASILRLMGGPDLNTDPPAPHLKGFTIEAMTPSDPKPLIEINEAGEAVTVTTETTIEVEEPTDYTNE